MESGCIVQAGGQFVSFGVAVGGIGTPAGDIVPAVAHSGGVAVNRDEDNILLANGPAESIDTAAALRQGDVFLFRNEKPGIVAEVGKRSYNLGSNLAVIFALVSLFRFRLIK